LLITEAAESLDEILQLASFVISSLT